MKDTGIEISKVDIDKIFEEDYVNKPFNEEGIFGESSQHKPTMAQHEIT